ncbi:MAG: hypothetical protein GY808_10690 [Gammaproteobacteria bacterium]|nr:hypothetical protein [Gammaproteobacteria bacterium]
MINRYVLLLTVLILYSHGLIAVDAKLKDPTRPPIYTTPKAGTQQNTELLLTEVKIAKKGRQAVINGQRLKKGDPIAGYRLKKIEVGYVILANKKETLRLNLISSRLIRKKL